MYLGSQILYNVSRSQLLSVKSTTMFYVLTRAGITHALCNNTCQSYNTFFIEGI